MRTKELVLIPTKDILRLLPLINKHTDKAFHTGSGESTYESLIGKALTGDAQVWALMEEGKCYGICTTELMTYHNYRCLHLITLGADPDTAYGEFHYGLEEFAKHHGCKDIQFWGRPGWSKTIGKNITGKNDEKYKETYRVFSMELEYEQI
tara:strand:+ start:2545 stop:2997 length:453 start_codon:yes stop_codon:yes gene_type:complete